VLIEFIASTLMELYYSALHNYLVWQTVRNFAACLSKAFRDAYKNLRKALIGSDGGEEPWRYCVTDTSNGEKILKVLNYVPLELLFL
jgi:Peptidase family M13